MTKLRPDNRLRLEQNPDIKGSIDVSFEYWDDGLMIRELCSDGFSDQLTFLAWL